MMGSPLLNALSTSLATCWERFVCVENTRTRRRLLLKASMSALRYGSPGRMSRGAIQQRIFFSSSVAQMASAVALSLLE